MPIVKMLDHEKSDAQSICAALLWTLSRVAQELDELILIAWKTEGQCIKLMQQHISKGRVTSPPWYNLVSENGSLLPAANTVNRHSEENNREY